MHVENDDISPFSKALIVRKSGRKNTMVSTILPIQIVSFKIRVRLL